MINQTKFCKKCLFPDTKPDLFFNEEGICDACLSAERKNGINNSVDWSQRDEDFKKILEEARENSGNKYNCIVPVSGGKDSTWQVYAMKVIHKMNPLAVTFDQFDQTTYGEYNLKVMKEIGVDHIQFTLNPQIVKKLVKKGFEVIGDPYWVNHVGIWTVPMHLAIMFQAPLVIFGENPIFEYGGPENSRDNMIMNKKWRQELGGMRGYREEDVIDHEIKEEDISMLYFPEDELISKNKIMGTFLGHFYKWEPFKHTDFVKELGWKALPKPPAGAWMKEENIDMQFIDIRERIKYLKYGYGRASDQLSLAIRNSKITRVEAVKAVKLIDGKVEEKNIQDFCKYLSITREQYNETMDSFVNTDIFYKNKNKEWLLKKEIE